MLPGCMPITGGLGAGPIKRLTFPTPAMVEEACRLVPDRSDRNPAFTSTDIEPFEVEILFK